MTKDPAQNAALVSKDGSKFHKKKFFNRKEGGKQKRCFNCDCVGHFAAAMPIRKENEKEADA